MPRSQPLRSRSCLQKKGLALLGAGAALVSGHPELITASVSADGVQFGGIIGASAPIAFGLWETLRNEFK